MSIKESIVEINSDSEEIESDLLKRRDSMEEFNERGCNEIVLQFIENDSFFMEDFLIEGSLLVEDSELNTK